MRSGLRRASAHRPGSGTAPSITARTLVTRVGKLELRVPQDRDGRFSTELFERYQRSKQALVATLAEMYVQGVSTRKVKAISAINKRLDDSLAAFARRPLAEPYPYLILTPATRRSARTASSAPRPC